MPRLKTSIPCTTTRVSNPDGLITSKSGSNLSTPSPLIFKRMTKKKMTEESSEPVAPDLPSEGPTREGIDPDATLEESSGEDILLLGDTSFSDTTATVVSTSPSDSLVFVTISPSETSSPEEPSGTTDATESEPLPAMPGTTDMARLTGSSGIPTLDPPSTSDPESSSEDQATPEDTESGTSDTATPDMVEGTSEESSGDTEDEPF